MYHLRRIYVRLRLVALYESELPSLFVPTSPVQSGNSELSRICVCDDSRTTHGRTRHLQSPAPLRSEMDCPGCFGWTDVWSRTKRIGHLERRLGSDLTLVLGCAFASHARIRYYLYPVRCDMASTRRVAIILSARCPWLFGTFCTGIDEMRVSSA